MAKGKVGRVPLFKLLVPCSLPKATMLPCYTDLYSGSSRVAQVVLRLGVLGAAGIAQPHGHIMPAKSYPEVVVQVVAARNRERAEAFAKKHETLEDPNIDDVLVPLPDSLHFEWAVKALRAGKHAEILFNMPELSEENGPVLLEASHNRFHPSCILLTSLFNRANVVVSNTNSMVHRGSTTKNDLYLNYPIAGGTIMVILTASRRCKPFSVPSQPSASRAPRTTTGTISQQANFRFPNVGTGEAASTMPGFYSLETIAVAWHRIDVRNPFEIRNRADGYMLKSWTEFVSRKAYSFREAGGSFADLPGEFWGILYRDQLEEFVSRIKGRRTQFWIIDVAHEKNAPGPRPLNQFKA
ncbi:hypothetical protein BX600DRAFT_488635 [Xylariales sp. PMI_506]|nr:hypothetical protein BX600DRAFT_488635 [Xylariales sp. PMI_506]